MSDSDIERFEQLAAVTGRVARAAAELEAARSARDVLPASAADLLDELADQVQALHLLLANEVERAWNLAEAEARRARRAEILGRIHDAVTAETPVTGVDVARLLAPSDPSGLAPEGPAAPPDDEDGAEQDV